MDKFPEEVQIAEEDVQENGRQSEMAEFIRAFVDPDSPCIDLDIKLTKKILNEDPLCSKYSALHLACKYNNLQLVKHFVENGWNVNSYHLSKETPLLTLLNRHAFNIDIAEYLINMGADLDLTDQYQFTPLHIAAMRGHFSAVEIILRHPCDVNAKAIKGITPILYAISRESMEMVKLLIANGANVDTPNPKGPWTFRRSCENTEASITLLLLQKCNFTTTDGILKDYSENMYIINLSPKVLRLLLTFGVTPSAIKCLDPYPLKEKVPDYKALTTNVCSLKQLSRIAVRNMFYSKWRNLSINEIMKNLHLPIPICKYLTYNYN